MPKARAASSDQVQRTLSCCPAWSSYRLSVSKGHGRIRPMWQLQLFPWAERSQAIGSSKRSSACHLAAVHQDCPAELRQDGPLFLAARSCLAVQASGVPIRSSNQDREFGHLSRKPVRVRLLPLAAL